MPTNRSTDALKKARQDFEAREEARYGGLTGRIKQDKRADSGYVADFNIGLDEIGPQGLQIKEALPQAWLIDILGKTQENKEIPTWTAEKDGYLEVILHRDKQLVRLKGQLELLMARPCDRCLQNLSYEFQKSWELHFLPAPLNLETEFNLGIGDMGEAHAHLPVSDDVESGPDAYYYEGERLDLLAALLEEVFLNLPSYIRCADPQVLTPEGGCSDRSDQGVWSPKSQPKWVDPRWAGLLEMKDKLPEN